MNIKKGDLFVKKFQSTVSTMSKTRKISSFFSTVGIMALVVTGCGTAASSSNNSTSSSPTKPQITVNVAYFTNPNPEKVAKEQGLFTKYTNAKINWVQESSGGPALAAMASGALDIVSAIGNPAIATSIAKGLDFKVIWVNENSSEALVAKSGIKSVSDLKGKSVGVAFGSTSQFTLMGALALNHVPASSVKIIDMQPSDQVAAWKRGDIQAAYVWQPFLSQMANDGGHILVESSQLATQGYPVFDAVIVNTKFAKAHPDIVKGFVKAEAEGTTFYEQHPNQSYQLIAKNVGISPEEAKTESITYTFPNAQQQVSTWLGSGTTCNSIVEQGIIATSTWLASSNNISSVPNQSTVCNAIDSSYAQAAQ